MPTSTCSPSGAGAAGSTGELELTLVSPYERHLYSGMVPGYLQGTYAETDLTFDLRALAARAGARFIAAKADRIDAAARVVEVAGERLPYDLLSLDVGSEPAGLATPGVREHALTVRPMNRAAALRRRAEELFVPGADSAVDVTVVGGGAAGVEVAFALDRLARERGAPARVTIVEAAAGVVPEFSTTVQRIADAPPGGARNRRARRPPGRHRRAGERDARRRHAPALAADRLDRGRGRAPTARGLRRPEGSGRLPAGRRDPARRRRLADLRRRRLHRDRRLPRARQGRRLRGPRGADPRPQPARCPLRRRASTLSSPAGFLALLNSADGRAIWRWKALAGHSRLAWRLKDRLDRAFLRRYPEAR